MFLGFIESSPVRSKLLPVVPVAVFKSWEVRVTDFRLLLAIPCTEGKERNSRDRICEDHGELLTVVYDCVGDSTVEKIDGSRTAKTSSTGQKIEIRWP